MKFQVLTNMVYLFRLLLIIGYIRVEQTFDALDHGKEILLGCIPEFLVLEGELNVVETMVLDGKRTVQPEVD